MSNNMCPTWLHLGKLPLGTPQTRSSPGNLPTCASASLVLQEDARCKLAAHLSCSSLHQLPEDEAAAMAAEQPVTAERYPWVDDEQPAAKRAKARRHALATWGGGLQLCGGLPRAKAKPSRWPSSHGATTNNRLPPVSLHTIAKSRVVFFAAFSMSRG